MSNYKSYQYGLNHTFLLPVIKCSENRKSSNIKKPFRCHFCFLLLIFFQIFSTFLMLISLTFSVEMISAEEYKMENFTTHSGIMNIDSDVDLSSEEILHRSRRRLSSFKESQILLEDNVRALCTNINSSRGNFIDRFRSLSKVRMSYCDMFDVSTVIYPFMMTDSDFVMVSSDIRFPTFDSRESSVIETVVREIPEQLLTLTNNGEIRASLKSSHKLISSHFGDESDCKSVLVKMIAVDDSVREAVLSFKETLVKNHCDFSWKSVRLKWRISCDKCEIAYKNWLCTQYFDMFTPITLQSSNNKEALSALIGIKSCPAWCSKVETDCVYFTPAKSNGGEPAFLCDESHYHHNARYRLNSKPECGADLPWKFCCYSQSLLNKLQNSSLTNRTADCSTNQYKCLTKIIKAIYQMKSLSPSPLNQSKINNNCAPSLFCHLNLVIFLTSFFLYFYIEFMIR